jgi:hypothetical protein
VVAPLRGAVVEQGGQAVPLLGAQRRPAVDQVLDVLLDLGGLPVAAQLGVVAGQRSHAGALLALFGGHAGHRAVTDAATVVGGGHLGTLQPQLRLGLVLLLPGKARAGLCTPPVESA